MFVTAVTAALLALPANAGATLPVAVSFEGTARPILVPDDYFSALRMRVTAGPSGADFGLYGYGRSWGAHNGGSPLIARSPALEGPGSVLPWEVPVVVPAIFLRYRSCSRNSTAVAVETKRNRVVVPPNETTTLRIPVYLTAPPWPGTDYSIPFELFDLDTAEPPRIKGPGIRIDSPPVSVQGMTGVRFLRTKMKKIRLPSGRIRVKLRGKTDPPLRREKIHVAVIPAPENEVGDHGRPINDGEMNSRDHRFLKKTRTDRKGRFAVTSKPVKPGPLLDMYRFETGNETVLPDWACGPGIGLR
jgi:hypothetical protein